MKTKTHHDVQANICDRSWLPESSSDIPRLLSTGPWRRVEASAIAGEGFFFFFFSFFVEFFSQFQEMIGFHIRRTSRSETPFLG